MFRFVILLFLLVPSLVHAEQIISALSADKVNINSNFDGTDLVIFGSIERDAVTISRSTGYDLAIIVKGPAVDIVTRRKERTFGIWINRTTHTFLGVPSFYAINSTKPVAELAGERVLTNNQIGLENIVFPEVTSASGVIDANREFIHSYHRLKAENDQYHVDPEAITFPGRNLFTTTFSIPPRVPVGDYTIEMHLFSQGALLASSEKSFSISKVGNEQFIYDFSRNKSLLFGLLVVAMAVFVGWFGGVVFRRD